MEITFPRHFRGPLTSANGGYASGRLAAFVDADEVEVTLRLPPPLDRPLAVVSDGDGVRLLDGDALVAEARPASLDVDAPAPVSLDVAEVARDRHERGWSPSSTSASSAACVMTGSSCVSGRSRDGSRCTRRRSRFPSLARRSSGQPIDCPGAYAVGAEGRGDIVLGRMTARVDRVPEVGEQCVVASWPLGEDGRKLFAGTALFAADGELLALAQQVWIAPKT